MDGVLGRANALCIGTLWHAFKFVMNPRGLQLAVVFPPSSSAAVFVAVNGLAPAWYGLALAVAVTSTRLELYSPRGTDDFTMATGTALVCWAFDALVPLSSAPASS